MEFSWLLAFIVCFIFVVCFASAFSNYFIGARGTSVIWVYGSEADIPEDTTGTTAD